MVGSQLQEGEVWRWLMRAVPGELIGTAGACWRITLSPFNAVACWRLLLSTRDGFWFEETHVRYYLWTWTEKSTGSHATEESRQPEAHEKVH